MTPGSNGPAEPGTLILQQQRLDLPPKPNPIGTQPPSSTLEDQPSFHLLGTRKRCQIAAADDDIGHGSFSPTLSAAKSPAPPPPLTLARGRLCVCVCISTGKLSHRCPPPLLRGHIAPRPFPLFPLLSTLSVLDPAASGGGDMLPLAAGGGSAGTKAARAGLSVNFAPLPPPPVSPVIAGSW